MEIQEKEREREFELEKLRLSSDLNTSHVATHTDRFVPSREVRMVPPFNEAEVDKYLQHFEKVAVNCNWPREFWPIMLQSVLKGKAQEAYSALSATDCADYDIVKTAILKAYELVPEAYRQKFRHWRKSDKQTYVEFAHDKEVYFERWCISKKVDGEFENLRQLMLIEEFKRCVPDDIKTYLDEKTVSTLAEAATMADDYALTHKKKYPGSTLNKFQKKNTSDADTGVKPSYSSSGKEKSHDGPKSNNDNRNAQKDKSNSPTCNYCKKAGHIVSECWKLKNKNSDSSPNALVSSLKSNFERVPEIKTETFDMPVPVMKDSNSVRAEFLPFVSEGFVSLRETDSPVPITILRDTGATQSLLLNSTLKFSDESATGESILAQGIEGSYVDIPLHSVYLTSNLVTGQVLVGLRPSLPVKGISLLLGNDLAGGKVESLVQMTSEPSTTDKMSEDETTDLYPSCAVTRAMAKKALEVDSSCIDLSETFVGHQDQNISDQRESSDEKSDLSLSRAQLIAEQENDPEIKDLASKALSQEELDNVPVGYYLKDGVLMRKWRPSDAPANEDWAVRHQVVVPKIFRPEILNLAHKIPMGGHFGINKTMDKIMKHYFWPGMRKDVCSYCKTCHTCQMVGKPNIVNQVAPLCPIPAFEAPFSRVIIDCVGPLPKTRSGNQYLLTIMCASTRFPEAIPLRNIKAPSISKALIKFFTLVGLPKEVQSDQGSNFMSGLFQQVVYELGANQIRSSAYHPESQGALERFHSTLKTMIKTYCHDNEKDWDEGVHLLLFAARESVQESLVKNMSENDIAHIIALKPGGSIRFCIDYRIVTVMLLLWYVVNTYLCAYVILCAGIPIRYCQLVEGVT